MILGADGEKMSKSRGNVINPDDVVKEYGADALRLYEMFMGPLEAVKPWQTSQLSGVVRFRDRVYNVITSSSSSSSATALGSAGAGITGASTATTTTTGSSAKPNNNNSDLKLMKEMNKIIKKVTNDIDNMNFNTAISALMIYTNTLTSIEDKSTIPLIALETLVLLIAPFAPHLAEECWSLLGHTTSLTYTKWPIYDEAMCIDNTAVIAIQINGKTRGTIEVEKSLSQEDISTQALLQPTIIKYTTDKVIKKTIYVPGKILNYIVV